MHRRRFVAGAAVALGLLAVVATPASAKPPIPGRSVTATLINHTACTFKLTGKSPSDDGHVTQTPAPTIPPGGSTTWKVIGWATTDPDALVIYVYTAQPGCAAAGESRGYLTANTDPQGMSYRDDACSVDPAPQLRDWFSGEQAYHAALSIAITPANGSPNVMPKALRPLAGQC
jgi:hypothetical protein